MGANASATVAGVGTATDTGSGWWFRKAGAIAATYDFAWTLTTDATTTTGTTPSPPAAKFLAGPLGVGWGVNTKTQVGGLGSTASATQSGSSTVNFGAVFNTYSSTSSVSATAAAVPTGNASATSKVNDPWTVPVDHTPGCQTYLLFTITPDFILFPTLAAGFDVSGSFGRISLRLDGQLNKPHCDVTLAAGWSVYRNLPFPKFGIRFRAPRNPLDAAALRKLFLRQHDPSKPLWHWRGRAPLLTFVKPLATSVSSEDLSVDVSVSDEDAKGDGRRGGGGPRPAKAKRRRA